MTNTLKLLERARAKCEPPTWYRLAKELGVSTQRMSNWSRGIHHPDMIAAWKLADFLDADRTDVLALIMAETYKDAPQADFWERLTPRVLPAAVAALTLAAAGNQDARGFGEQACTASGCDGVYIMRSGLDRRRGPEVTRLRRSALRARTGAGAPLRGATRPRLGRGGVRRYHFNADCARASIASQSSCRTIVETLSAPSVSASPWTA